MSFNVLREMQSIKILRTVININYQHHNINDIAEAQDTCLKIQVTYHIYVFLTRMGTFLACNLCVYLSFPYHSHELYELSNKIINFMSFEAPGQKTLTFYNLLT